MKNLKNITNNYKYILFNLDDLTLLYTNDIMELIDYYAATFLKAQNYSDLRTLTKPEVIISALETWNYNIIETSNNKEVSDLLADLKDYNKDDLNIYSIEEFIEFVICL